MASADGLQLALGVFHCGAQNFDAIGGTADIDWPPAPIASEAYDPQLSKAGPKSRSAAVSCRTAVLSFGMEAQEGIGRGPPRFGTIQVCPKDLPALLRQAQRAVD